MNEEIYSYIDSSAAIVDHGTYLESPIKNPGEGLAANIYYFNQPEWAEEYLTYCHRSPSFKSRWEAALGDLEGKVVVDIGCGPGNVFATVTSKPRLLIGVDVAPVSLRFAAKYGYTPVLADASKLPFVSGFADVVVLNAALHHCEDMAAILREAARILKPGGLIVTDHDPQLSAWDYKGIAKLLWNGRLLYYRIVKHGFHKTDDQQTWGLACEIHHKPGHGVTEQFFRGTLEPLGFDLQVYPHNHEVGEQVLKGERGKAALKYRMGNILSGRNPKKPGSALSLMCLARKRMTVTV
ncbi:class I SAM-dependent methyltransferase [Pedobacter sp. SYSU D00535]|uniref:class I SAM-dependent methyltransferase n=1 Tax=Pedobacter sp. SYSU D00535 TaxID=2810308 RepID=UPI001A96F335|nr:class I SAM-dependent methyltransferase [Pedobacter sp. SYSU D00535]